MKRTLVHMGTGLVDVMIGRLTIDKSSGSVTIQPNYGREIRSVHMLSSSVSISLRESNQPVLSKMQRMCQVSPPNTREQIVRSLLLTELLLRSQICATRKIEIGASHVCCASERLVVTRSQPWKYGTRTAALSRCYSAGTRAFATTHL